MLIDILSIVFGSGGVGTVVVLYYLNKRKPITPCDTVSIKRITGRAIVEVTNSQNSNIIIDSVHNSKVTIK